MSSIVSPWSVLPLDVAATPSIRTLPNDAREQRVSAHGHQLPAYCSSSVERCRRSARITARGRNLSVLNAPPGSIPLPAWIAADSAGLGGLRPTDFPHKTHGVASSRAAPSSPWGRHPAPVAQAQAWAPTVSPRVARRTTATSTPAIGVDFSLPAPVPRVSASRGPISPCGSAPTPPAAVQQTPMGELGAGKRRASEYLETMRSDTQSDTQAAGNYRKGWTLTDGNTE